ncbi:MAG: copper chaperone PCu(A)C [Pseudomonadota bacterium]
MKYRIGTTAILVVCFLLTGCEQNAPISTEAAWVRLPPPESSAAAAYMTINNHAAIALSITDVRSNGFQRVEMHRTQVADGVMQMRPVESIDIPPGGTVKLEQGGLHLMLMQPIAPLVEGTPVPLAFYSDDELVLEMTIAVSRQAPE